MTEVYIGLGSNLGDKAGNVRAAIDFLERSDGIQNVELSPLFRTAPVGKVDQDWFVNAAARLETDLDPRGLLELVLDCERALKRVRNERWGPRTLDIDVLLYGDRVIEEEGLVVPHPRISERAFVLAPLNALNPGLRIGGKLVGELLEAVKDQSVEPLKLLVAILGASPKPERYANMAQRLLMEEGYPVLPVNPAGQSVLGVPGVVSLQNCPESVDTVTLYVGSARLETVADSIVKKRPRRVIFNPGTENESVRAAFEEAGIQTLEACTLVLLRTGQF